MSEFKAMKFRVNSPEHSRQIQEKLFEMGYRWNAVHVHMNYTDKPFLFANENSYIGQCGEEYYFSINTYPEYTLVNNEFVLVSTQSDCEEPPIGLVPSYIWKEQRIADIVNAMKRYVDANKPVPVGWAEELVQHLNGE